MLLVLNSVNSDKVKENQKLFLQCVVIAMEIFMVLNLVISGPDVLSK